PAQVSHHPRRAELRHARAVGQGTESRVRLAGGAAPPPRRAGENGAGGGRRLTRPCEVRDAEEGGADRAGLHDRVGRADPHTQGEAAGGGEELQAADRAGVRGGGSHRCGYRELITPAPPPTAPALRRAASTRPEPTQARPRSPAAVPAAARAALQ